MLKHFMIGEIVNVHGVKGALKVLPLTDDPLRFQKLKSVCIVNDNRKDAKEYAVRNIQFSGGFVLLSIDGIDTREQAELLKGGFIRIDRKDAIELPFGFNFIGDLIGCKVYEEDGNCLGAVKNVLQTGSNDVYEVIDNRGRAILIPVLKDVVLDVDIEKEKILVKLLPGLKEIYYED